MKAIAICQPADDEQPRGYLNVRGYVDIVTLQGHTRNRSVLIGKEWSLTLAEAKKLAQEARGANENVRVVSHFTIDL